MKTTLKVFVVALAGVFISCSVALTIYNVIGQQVTTLVNEVQPAGRYNLRWDARNLASGVYLYRLKAGDFVQTKKMVVVR